MLASGLRQPLPVGPELLLPCPPQLLAILGQPQGSQLLWPLGGPGGHSQPEGTRGAQGKSQGAKTT